jgi:hypothetical protein
MNTRDAIEAAVVVVLACVLGMLASTGSAIQANIEGLRDSFTVYLPSSVQTMREPSVVLLQESWSDGDGTTARVETRLGLHDNGSLIPHETTTDLIARHRRRVAALQEHYPKKQ